MDNNKCLNCIKLQKKLEKYKKTIEQLQQLDNSIINLEENINLEDSVVIINKSENLNKMSKFELKALKEQDNLHNAEKIKSYAEHATIIYNIGYYTIKFGKYILPFL